MHTTRIINIVIEPIDNQRHRVIFCRKGLDGYWFPGKQHIVLNGTDSLRRAYRAAVVAKQQ